MSTQRYSVTPQPIDVLLAWVRSGEIAIPEIQRPFVWEPTKVRNLLDSLCAGYPVDYLIAWRKPTVKLKDGNQIANFVIAQSEINIAIGDKDPQVYYKELAEQCAGGAKKYGGITDRAAMVANLHANCLPASLLDGVVPDYETFLRERRLLMARKIQTWFHTL